MYEPLTLLEREQIDSLRKQGCSGREIARKLSRPHTTIAYELKRISGKYSAARATAHRARTRSNSNKKKLRLEKDASLRRSVVSSLRSGWSAETIAIHKRRFGEMVSAEAIYAYMRKYHLKRRPLNKRTFKRKQSTIAQQLPIFGEWECDVITFTHKRQVVCVFLERVSRYCLLFNLPDRTAKHLAQAVLSFYQKVPKGLVRTIVLDRGPETVCGKWLGVELPVEILFCSEGAWWEKPKVERLNRDLRRYYPVTFRGPITKRRLLQVEGMLNTKPRVVLYGATPSEVFSRYVVQ